MSAPDTAADIAADVAAGRRSAVEICRATLERIDAVDPTLHAFREVTADHALAAAQRVDRRVASGQPVGPLAGVPVAVKDNICTRFSYTTCGSKMLHQYRSPYDATVVQRIEQAGGVIVGKTNMDEFGMGSSSENSAFERTRNPWSADAVPGGSSGGSAAAVAAAMVPLALGSDTGGSIRQPAAMCGVTGIKPTYGSVSRYGLVAYGSSLDQIGPISRTVADAALMLSVISGNDANDSTSVDRTPDDFLNALSDERLEHRAANLTIGVPREYFADGLDPQVAAAVEAALSEYRKLGAKTVEVSLPHTPHCIATYYLIAMAECSSNLARFDGVHYGHRTASPAGIVDLYSASRSEAFGEEVKRRIMLGTFALSAGYYDAYYLKALRVRRLIQQDFERAFEQADVLCCPTSPTPAFGFGEKTADPLTMYLCDVYTIAANLAGIPGLSIPCGFTTAGLPIGLQILGPLFGETAILQSAALYERETDWGRRRPPAP